MERMLYHKSLIYKEKAIIADGFSNFGPLTNERCNYIKMIGYLIIRKLRPLPPVILMKVIGKSIVNNSSLRFLFQFVVVKILGQM